MIYWYTGQPGHGKTLQAINKALEFQKKGRIVYVCNVRDFDYAKTGMLEMKPEQFRDWMNFLPDGAVALVDEAYEHGMLPKRPPSAALPPHVEQLAKHRHRGLDFIFVCQSPDKQVDVFVHDLIEEHVHVRRRFGTSFQHLRTFDRFERNPEKGHPLTIKRTRLPKHVFGLYKSTELDTTEKKIPWYFIALPIAVASGLGLMYYTFGNMGSRLSHDEVQPASAAPGAAGGNGAQATVSPAAPSKPLTAAQYARKFIPRIPSQPWSAPAYDGLATPSEPPRVFCMSAGAGELQDGQHSKSSCTCLTEQGTRYTMAQKVCELVARNGQYEPLFDERNTRLLDAEDQIETNAQAIADSRTHGAVIPGKMADAGEQSNVVNSPEAHF